MTRLLRAAVSAPVGTPLVALLRVATVHTLDTITLLSGDRSANRFVFTFDLRTFDGELGANVFHYAVLEADVGPLAAGGYECVARFDQVGSPPEQADSAGPVTATFTVV